MQMRPREAQQVAGLDEDRDSRRVLERRPTLRQQRIAPRRLAQPLQVPLGAGVRHRPAEQRRPDHHGGARLDREDRAPQVDLGHDVGAPRVAVRGKIPHATPAVRVAARLQAQDEAVGVRAGGVEAQRLDHRSIRHGHLRVAHEGAPEVSRSGQELRAIERSLGVRRRMRSKRRADHSPRARHQGRHRRHPPERQDLATEQPLPVEGRLAVRDPGSHDRSERIGR